MLNDRIIVSDSYICKAFGEKDITVIEAIKMILINR